MTWEHRGRVAIAGVGFSQIDRRSEQPLGEYALAAARAAVDDCGLSLAELDGFATYPSAPFAGAVNRSGEDVITPEFFLSTGMFPNATWFSQAGAGLIMTSIGDAVNALMAGACRYALVWRAMFVPSGSYGLVQGNRFGSDAQFAAPYGIASPAHWHALAYRRYVESYGADREALCAIALNSRRNANLNPNAYFHDKSLSREEYFDARVISDPIHLFDCDVPVTACVAMVLTTTERAHDLKNPPAHVASIAQQSTPRMPSLDYALNDPLESGKPMMDRLWRDSGISVKDVAAMQLYDGFSPSVLYWLEAAGVCGRGEAHEFVREERIRIGGDMPLNTFGGSLSQGRLHGMGHIAEAVLQVTDRAASRQVLDAQSVLVTDGSPMLRGGGMIVTRDV